MIGFINLNKPVGLSSAQTVNKVKQILHLPKSCKIGHTGTLDPQASGVLPIALGRATKLFDFMLAKQKTYIAEFTFGYQTDTLDSVGEVVLKNDTIPTLDEIKSTLPSFLGKIAQIPPQYSAKSVGGRRAYDLARSGKVTELKPVEIEIFEFEVLQQINNETFTFKITCGSGTYIRGLARDLGTKLNSCATMTALTRVKVGVFDINNSITFAELNEQSIQPSEIVLTKLDSIHISKLQSEMLFQGKKVDIDKQDGLYKIYQNDLIGLGNVFRGNLKMQIWLKLEDKND